MTNEQLEFVFMQLRKQLEDISNKIDEQLPENTEREKGIYILGKELVGEAVILHDLNKFIDYLILPKQNLDSFG